MASSSFKAAEKKTLMVVDDDKDTLRISELGLEKAGFQVHAFSDSSRRPIIYFLAKKIDKYAIIQCGKYANTCKKA